MRGGGEEWLRCGAIGRERRKQMAVAMLVAWALMKTGGVGCGDDEATCEGASRETKRMENLKFEARRLMEALVAAGVDRGGDRAHVATTVEASSA